ncbi:recombinase family protein [Sphingomonas aerolata]|uniref:recombinase family protein n=1 Tax=Sphingomonas aerolata TaxID=185951 RepID=UPI003361F1E2
MTHAAVAYGRKSFDDPDERTSSVDDQQLFAQGYAERCGLEVIAFHGDDGITGATMERPGLQEVLKLITKGQVRNLIIEDVDRLSRDAEHLHYMVKLFRLHQVAVHTVVAGKVDDLVLAFKGIIGEQQRMRIAYTTRRGLRGKATRGGATGGRVLGYRRAVTGEDAQGRELDQLEIDDEQAELVRRIFRLYAEGWSLKRICNALNADGIPSPRARERGKYNAGVWNPSTLSGDVTLGEGILNNELYIGRRIFNRQTWVEVPNERRGFSRRPRLNPEAEWIIRDEPQLRIIDQLLWEQVKGRQAEARRARDAKFKLTGNPLAGAKRPTHLLSGLVTCGACGAAFLATGAGRWRCKGHRTGTCDNGSITTIELEARALAGIRERLLTPAVIKRFAVLLQQELAAAAQAGNAERATAEHKLVEIRTRIANLVTQIEEDEDAPRALTTRVKDLEAEERRLEEIIAATPASPVVRLPANYESLYTRAIAELDTHLASTDGASARQTIRPLIEKIVVQPGSARGGKRRPIQLYGDLYRMLAFAEEACAPNAQQARLLRDGPVVIPLVAGTGFEPVTFRL